MHHQMLNHADSISMFIIALGMAFSHCYAMCGGIVLAVAQIKNNGGFARIFALQAFYNLGRIATYCAIGAVCANLGAKIAITNASKGGIFIIAGFFMALFGVGYLAMPKILRILEPNIGGFALFSRIFRALLARGGTFSAFGLGVLNGLLPCGLVYFFAMNAAISGSILGGIKIMLILGVASALPLLLLGAFSAVLKITRFKNAIAKISAFLIILFGIYTIFKGFGILFA